MTKEYPAWRYGPGVEGEKHDGKAAFERDGKWLFKKLCNGPHDVPAGWVDSPANVAGEVPTDEAPKRRGRPPKDKTPEVTETNDDGS